MATEVRHILFRPGEVVEAIRDYYRKQNEKLPGDTVFSYAAELNAGAVRFRMIMAAKPGEDRPQQVVTESETLISALILHCRERSIPLPSKAAKTLILFGEQICLVTTMAQKRQALPSL